VEQTIIYDTDDLMFDVESFKKTDAYHNFNELQKKQYEDGVGLKILKSEQVKAISTTTIFLAEKLKQFGKPVYVVRNKLAKRELRWAREARKIYLDRTKKGKNVRLGYFSGSVSHNRDFTTIIPALEIILKRYPQVKLYLVGYLDLNDKFYKKFQKQIIQLPFAPRKKHYQNIAQVDINLAPLEMNDFCQAKSELKFFEAGIIGIPTIAVRNKTFSKVIDERAESLKGSVSCLDSKRNGLLASDINEWVQKLELLINDKEMRVSIGEGARQVVLKKYLTSSGDNKKYYKFLEDILENNRPLAKPSS
jgi:glycosyltransferase involved in cell wall biosynthesis